MPAWHSKACLAPKSRQHIAVLAGCLLGTQKPKADSTLRCSRAVPHPSTNRALRRLTSEVGRDPVHSTRYGRRRDLLPRSMCEMIVSYLGRAERTFHYVDSHKPGGGEAGGQEAGGFPKSRSSHNSARARAGTLGPWCRCTPGAPQTRAAHVLAPAAGERAVW